MATKLTKKPKSPDCRLKLTIAGKEYVCDGYESAYFAEGVLPKKAHDYYVRHKDGDWCDIASVKAHKGTTANYWGTIVTTEPIDFSGEDEVRVDEWTIIEE